MLDHCYLAGPQVTDSDLRMRQIGLNQGRGIVSVVSAIAMCAGCAVDGDLVADASGFVVNLPGTRLRRSGQGRRCRLRAPGHIVSRVLVCLGQNDQPTRDCFIALHHRQPNANVRLATVVVGAQHDGPRPVLSSDGIFSFLMGFFVVSRWAAGFLASSSL